MIKTITSKFNFFLNLLFFGLLFAIVGSIIPNFYYTYLDTTQYFEITEITIDRETYKPGDVVDIEMQRTSRVTTNGSIVRELTLIKADGSLAEVCRQKTFATIDMGAETIHVFYQLPEELIDGEYFWRGPMTFEVRGNTKVSTFTTPVFNVIND